MQTFFKVNGLFKKFCLHRLIYSPWFIHFHQFLSNSLLDLFSDQPVIKQLKILNDSFAVGKNGFEDLCLCFRMSEVVYFGILLSFVCFWNEWERAACFTNDLSAKDLLWATCALEEVSMRMTPKTISLTYLPI